MKKMYIVKYSTERSCYEDAWEINIFVTNKKVNATRYVKKFNTMLKKWREYYKQYEGEGLDLYCLKDEYVDQHYERWYMLQNVHMCYWEEVELR